MHLDKLAPESIFQKIATHLEKRGEEIEYLFEEGPGFEKWIQGEIISSFYGMLYHHVYDKDWKIVQHENEEKISEIGREYQPDEEDDRKVDIFICESPILYHYMCEEDHEDGDELQLDLWNKDESKVRLELEKWLEESRFHYLELKVKILSLSDSGLSNDVINVANDAQKLEDLIHLDNNPASLISVGLFYIRPGKGIDDFDDKDAIESLKMSLTKHFTELKLNKNWKHNIACIGNQSYLTFSYLEK